MNPIQRSSIPVLPGAVVADRLFSNGSPISTSLEIGVGVSLLICAAMWVYDMVKQRRDERDLSAVKR